MSTRLEAAVGTRLESALLELAAAIREEVAAASLSAGPVPDRLLSIDEAARALGIGRTRLYGELSRGNLRSRKIGRRRVISSSALAEYAAAVER